MLKYAFLVLAACASGRRIEVREPSSLVVGYMSAHNLMPKAHFAIAKLETEDGKRVKPAHSFDNYVEAHFTTDYYVLAPGVYRLLDYAGEFHLKTLRTLPPKPAPDHVHSELDARTDSNADGGVTSERWTFAARAHPFYVLVTEDKPDAADDFYANTKLVSGATWLGPFTTTTELELTTGGTVVRGYSLDVAEQTSAPLEDRTMVLETVLPGRIGPSAARWDDKRGWYDVVHVANDADRVLYVNLAYTPDSEHMSGPDVAFFDEATGYRLQPQEIFSKQIYNREDHTGVLAIRVNGAVRVEIEWRQVLDRLGSGSYKLCVSTTERFCLEHNPAWRYWVD